MLDTNHVLDRFEISRTSVCRAVQDVSRIVQDAPDPLRTAHNLFDAFLSTDIRFIEPIHARTACKKMIEMIVKNNGVIEDELVVSNAAQIYADDFCADPKWSFLWAKPEYSTAVVTEQVAVVEGIDVQVAVKKDGTIKKGGKQVLVKEMYIKYVMESTPPMPRKEFVQLLIDELGVTLAFCNTYIYNLTKELGPPPVGFSDGKKGRKRKS